MIQACSQDFFTGRCDPTRGDGQNDMPETQVWVGRNAGGLRLHFEHFEEWEFLKLLVFKSIFFFNRVLYFTFNFFGIKMRDVTI